MGRAFELGRDVYMFCFQLVYKNKYEISSLIGVNLVRSSLYEYVENLENPVIEVTKEKKLWELHGVGIKTSSNTDDLITKCTVTK